MSGSRNRKGRDRNGVNNIILGRSTINLYLAFLPRFLVGNNIGSALYYRQQNDVREKTTIRAKNRSDTKVHPIKRSIV